jgi:hypothetical protein
MAVADIVWKAPVLIKGLQPRQWPTASDGKNQLVILNRIWSAAQRLEREIRELTVRSHVVLADGPGLKPQRLRGTLATAQLLSLTEENERRIRVAFQEI